MTTEEFVDSNPQCNVSIIWYWDAENQEWDGWAPDFLPTNTVFIPEFYNRYFTMMNAWDSYWVYCK